MIPLPAVKLPMPYFKSPAFALYRNLKDRPQNAKRFLQSPELSRSLNHTTAMANIESVSLEMKGAAALRSLAAAQAPLQQQPSMKPLNERAWADKVGSEYSQLFQEAAQAQSRAMTARNTLSRSQRSGMMDPSQLAQLSTQLWGAQGENKLDALARQALFRMSTSGLAGLEACLHPRDPLERMMLLSKMSELMGGGDSASQQMLQTVTRDLQDRHGDEIKALKNSADSFDVMHHTNAAGAKDDAGATALRSIYLSAGRTTGDAILSAPKLATQLLAKFDGAQFELALMQLGEGVLADLRSAHPSRHSERVSAALTNSNVFVSIRTALRLSQKMRSRLASLGEEVETTDPFMATKFLEEADRGCAEANQLARSLVGDSQAERMLQNRETLACLREIGLEIPLPWWPDLAPRLKLLADLDKLAESFNRPDHGPGFLSQQRLQKALPKSKTRLRYKSNATAQ